MAIQRPTPVNPVVPITRIISGPPNRGPGRVPPGPGSGQVPVVYPPAGPPEVVPPEVPPGPGSGQTPRANTTPILPVIPVVPVVPVIGNVNVGNNVIPPVPNYIEVLNNGTILVRDATALNFTGPGVSVSANGAVATLNITSGSVYGNSNVNALLAAYGSNTIVTTGNITGSYFLGNGSQLTGITAVTTYGNANVAANLAAFGTNLISTSGNITSGNIIGTLNGSGANVSSISATNISTGTLDQARLANAAVTLGSTALTLGATVTAVSGLTSIAATTFTGALSGAATTAATVTSNAQANITSVGTLTSLSVTGNITGGNILTGGSISATGNISSNYFIGNGSLLTGIANGVSSYGNANVAANLAAFGSNPISTTGNVTAGNFIGNVVGGGAGTPTISSTTNLDLSAVSAVRVIGGGTFRLPSLTTAQIANTIAANGDMIYNSSVNKFQGYENGAWANII